MQRRGLTYGLLIVVALAMGVIASGLPRMHGDPPLRETRTTAPAPSSTTTSAPTATTSTASVVHAPSTVTVLVAIASGINGAAAKRATRLSTAGYHVLTPTNTGSTPTSEVFFGSKAEDDARAVAAAVGIAGRDVHAMPAKPPVANAMKADVIVVIGRDLRVG